MRNGADGKSVENKNGAEGISLILWIWMMVTWLHLFEAFNLSTFWKIFINMISFFLLKECYKRTTRKTPWLNRVYSGVSIGSLEAESRSQKRQREVSPTLQNDSWSFTVKQIHEPQWNIQLSWQRPVGSDSLDTPVPLSPTHHLIVGPGEVKYNTNRP